MPARNSYLDSGYKLVVSTLSGTWQRTAGIRAAVGEQISKRTTPLVNYAKIALEYTNQGLKGAINSDAGQATLRGLANMNARFLAVFNPVISKSPSLTRGLQSINALNPIAATLLKSFAILTILPFIIAVGVGVAITAYSLAARAISLTVKAFIDFPRGIVNSIRFKLKSEEYKYFNNLDYKVYDSFGIPKLTRTQKAGLFVRSIPSIAVALPGITIRGLKDFGVSILKMPFISIKYAISNGLYATQDVLNLTPYSRIIAPWTFYRNTTSSQTSTRLKNLERSVDYLQEDTRNLGSGIDEVFEYAAREKRNTDTKLEKIHDAGRRNTEFVDSIYTEFKDFKENAEPVLRSFRRQEHTTDEGEGYTSFGSQHTQEEGNDRRQPQSGRGISGNRQVGRGKDLRHEQW